MLESPGVDMERMVAVYQRQWESETLNGDYDTKKKRGFKIIETKTQASLASVERR